MTLLIDLGNSRLKAALARPGGGVELLGEARHRGAGVGAALAGALAGRAPGPNALCANVAGEAAGRALTEALAAQDCSLSFVRATAFAGGVRCGYAEPARLGADRWAALLGARALCAGPCLVADAGSALTLDALARDGLHLGGWIVPGLGMMVEALEGRTGDLAALRRASTGISRAPFPADTGPAMEEGAALAATGAAEAALHRLEAWCGEPARLLVTGGDGPALAAGLARAELVPDLVLRGLAQAAAEVCRPGRAP